MKYKDLKGAKDKHCSRCGSDLMGGSGIVFLPHRKEYMKFCSPCYVGLGDIIHAQRDFILNQPSSHTAEDWKVFWESEVA